MVENNTPSYRGPAMMEAYKRDLIHVVEEWEKRRETMLADSEAKARFFTFRAFELTQAAILGDGPTPQTHLLGGNEISDIAIRAFNEAIDADGYETSYGCIEGAIRIALNRTTPQGRLNAETLAQEIVRAACELDDPADPDHEDTISIRVQDLEAVTNRRITAAIEIASRPSTTEGSVE